MNRRTFMKSAALAPLFGAMGGCFSTQSAKDEKTAAPVWSGKGHPLAGQKLPPWKPGEFQVHFIYTGVAESMFWILPDGTTMLLDCGDHPAWTRGKLAIWILPNGRKNAGEWVSRYVTRVNPAKTSVDYMMLSHHHSDHGGSDMWGAGAPRDWKGKKISVSGLMQAADALKFGTAFDRGWPNFNDPIPDERCDSNCYPHMRKVYDFLMQRDGLKMEQFKVGAKNQVAMRRNAAAYPSFSITNITGNGKILCRNGQVRDLYAELHNAKRLNENGMSLGLMVQYGPFRFYTAGDFSDNPKLPDGSRRNIEAELAKELDPVDVAKVNHHAHHSMPTELVAALQARVWTACMWDQLHITADSLTRLSDRAAYPGPRLIAPAVFSPERRFEDEGKPFVRDIAPEAFDAGHVVLNVAPGGNTYTVAYVTADDESMKVTGAYDFTSRGVKG